MKEKLFKVIRSVREWFSVHCSSLVVKSMRLKCLVLVFKLKLKKITLKVPIKYLPRKHLHSVDKILAKYHLKEPLKYLKNAKKVLAKY